MTATVAVKTGGSMGSAAAAGRDCVARAVDWALSSLQGRPASLVLMFPPVSLDGTAVAEQATRAAGGVPVAGMASEGVISADGPVPDGCSAIAFDDAFEVGVAFAGPASSDPYATGRDAAADALARLGPGEGHPLLLLFLDSASGDYGPILRGAYESAGGRVPLVGGGANGRHSAPFADGASRRDCVVAVAIRSPVPVAIGVAHGCSACAVPAIVTRADGRTITGLDGRAAESVYLEKLGRGGVRFGDAEFEALSVTHPLGQPELGGTVRLRHIRGRAAGGGLECAAEMPVNSVVAFMEQTRETIWRSAREATEQALRELGGRAQAALIFDCAGRKRVLGSGVDTEVEAIVSSFGGDVPEIAGLWTRGEVGRVRGPQGDHNHAIVVAVFG